MTPASRCWEDPTRFTIHPVKHWDLYELAEQAEACLWTTGEVDLSKDGADLKRLSEDERHVIENVLAFFAASDGIVIQNLCESFLARVTLSEARYFYGLQTGIETVHSKMYSLLLDAYVSNEARRNQLFSAVTTIPANGRGGVGAGAHRLDQSFATQLLAAACVEDPLQRVVCVYIFLKASRAAASPSPTS